MVSDEKSAVTWIDFSLLVKFPMASLMAQWEKKFTWQCRRCRFNTWIRKIPWSRKWHPTLVFLPGKAHEQRSLMGYGPWRHKIVRQDLATMQQSFPSPGCIQDSFAFPFQDYSNCESWSAFLRFSSYLRLTQLLELVGLYLWTNFGSFQLLSLSALLTPQSQTPTTLILTV